FAVVFIILSAKSSLAQVPTPNRTDAMDAPSKHVWNVFLAISWPALDPAKTGKRGVADTNKPLGAPGSATVWETWRQATPEVFLPTGQQPPSDYNDMSLVTKCPSGKVPEPAASHQVEAFIERQTPGRIRPSFDPTEGIAPVGTFGFGETRMNKATYDFILKNSLFNIPGQVAYAKAFIGRTKPALSFPVDSIEVKAAWIEMSDDQIKSGEDKTFYLVVKPQEVIPGQTESADRWLACEANMRPVPVVAMEAKRATRHIAALSARRQWHKPHSLSAVWMKRSALPLVCGV